MNPCIVYLAQNSQKDHHHSRDSRSMLVKSLDLLYKNYNDQFKHDILIFHEGDFGIQDQTEIIDGRREIKFCEIQFEIPDFLNPDEIPEKWDGIFSIGNRHMIRFYALQLFDILRDMGYDWFFRLDDDSFIHSKIDYNLFEYMSKNDLEYGYRVDVKDAQRTCFGFSEMVLAYLKAERIKPHTFLENFGESSKLNHEAFGLKGKVKRQITRLLDRVADKINHDLNNWPVSTEWNRWGYYNNFFITRIGFWHQSEVQSFLHFLDRVGGGYKYRWTDLIVQTAAVQIFLPQTKVHKFSDWTYEHATIKNGKLDWGGIYPGEGHEQSTEVLDFQKQFGKLRTANSH